MHKKGCLDFLAKLHSSDSFFAYSFSLRPWYDQNGGIHDLLHNVIALAKDPSRDASAHIQTVSNTFIRLGFKILCNNYLQPITPFFGQQFVIIVVPT